MNIRASIILLLFFTNYALAETAYDEISIGFIPSRYASYNGEAHTVMQAKVLSHFENQKFENLFNKIKSISKLGITENVTQFHQATQYIEAAYKGERIRLFYNGPSENPKFKSYEIKWLKLHEEFYSFLTNNMQPIRKNP